MTSSLHPAWILLVSMLLAACSASPTGAPTATSSPPTLAATEEPTTAPMAEVDPFRYYAFHGGSAHAGWDREVFDDWSGQQLELETERDTHDFYSAVVPTQRINAVMESDPAYDVISATVGGVFAEYARQGLITDITDLWEQNGWYEQFPASLVDMASIDGRQYFVPIAQQWNPIWYRTDIFEQQGLSTPQTWGELLAACDQLSEAGYTPITVSVRNWNAPTARWFTMLNVRLNGLEFHQQFISGQVPWTDTRVRAVFETWGEMFERNCFGENPRQTSYGQAAGLLEEGGAAMYLLGEWLSESYSGGFPETFDFFSVPPIDPEGPQVELAHVFGAFMPVEAEHQEAARTLLTHLGSEAVHQSSWEVLNRVGTNSAVDPALFSDLYRRGVEFVADADALVPLFEVSMSSSAMTRHGLAGFASYIGNQSDLDGLLERLEAIRVQEYVEP